MNLKSLGVVVALFGLLAVMAYWPYKSQADTELDVRNRVVRINSVTKSSAMVEADIYGCTGTLLSHNFILTNAHCIPTPDILDRVYVRRINDREYMDAVVVSSATKTDYALLKFSGLDTSTQLDFTKDWYLGEDIILYGNPGEQDFVLGHSRIVGYIFVRTPMNKIRTMFVYPCNESAPGFSGSGIYNLKGEYLGTHELGQEIPILYQVIEKFLDKRADGPLCYAIPAKEAMERNLDRPWRGFDLTDN